MSLIERIILITISLVMTMCEWKVKSKALQHQDPVIEKQIVLHLLYL